MIVTMIRVFARHGMLSDFGLLSGMANANRPMPVGVHLFVLLCTLQLSRTLLRLRRYVGDKKE